MMIDRYGFDTGTFASPAGTPFQIRALPPAQASSPYSVFEIVQPLEVQAGITAPWFGGGGGLQYELPTSITSLLESGAIRRLP